MASKKRRKRARPSAVGSPASPRGKASDESSSSVKRFERAAPDSKGAHPRPERNHPAPVREYLWLIAIAALFTTVLLLPVWISDGYLWGSGTDMVSYQYPLRSYAYAWLRRGVWPLWNPFLFSGVPFQTGVHSQAYPLTMLGLIFSTGTEIKLAISFHMTLAFFSAAALMRAFGLGRLASVLAGTMYALGGFMVAHLYAGHVDIITTSAFFPGVLLLFEWALRYRGLGWTVLAGLGLAVMLTTGHYQIIYLTLFALGLFTVARVLLGSSVVVRPLHWPRPFLREMELRQNAGQTTTLVSLLADWGIPFRSRLTDALGAAARLLVLGAVAGGLTSFQWLPTQQATSFSNRSFQSSYEFASSHSVPKKNWFTYLAPDLFGGSSDRGFFAPWSGWEGQAYLGVAAILLVLIALSLCSWRRIGVFLVLAGVATALGFGDYAPFLQLYFHLDPVVGRFRSPSRFVLVAGLFLSWLAAVGFDAWLSQEFSEARRKRLVRVILGALLSLVALVGWANGASDGGWIAMLFDDVGGALASPEPGLVAYVRNQLGLALLLAVVGGGLLIGGMVWPGRRQILGRALVLVLLLDLVVFGWPKLKCRPASDFELPAETISTLNRLNRGQQRVLMHPGLRAVNHGISAGVSHVGGYDTLVDRRYNQTFNLTRGQDPDRQVMKMASLQYGPLERTQGARFLVTPTPIQAFPSAQKKQFHGFRKVAETDGLLIYENPKALPRAFVVRSIEVLSSAQLARRRIASPEHRAEERLLWDKEEGGALPGALAPFLGKEPKPSADDVTLTELSPNRVAIDVRLASEGIVTLTDAPWPGWTVAVDGKPGSLFSVNGGLHRAVHVKEGSHRVVFSYFPDTLKAGLWISCPMWLVIALYLTWGIRRQIRQGTTAPSIP